MKAPFFYVKPIRRYDVAKLRSDEFLFEDIASSLENRAKNIKAVRELGSQDLNETASFVERCDGKTLKCNNVVCNLCGRLYRRWLASRILKQAEATEGKEMYMLTVYGDIANIGDLHDLNVRNFQSRFRRRVERATATSPLMIGGTEIAWNESTRQWLMHAHLIAFDLPFGALKNLKLACQKDNRPGMPALKSRRIYNILGVAPYVQKFQFYHHPGKRTGPERPRPKPLPDAQKQELFQFLSGHNFRDFLFLVGCRRQGKHILRSCP